MSPMVTPGRRRGTAWPAAPSQDPPLAAFHDATAAPLDCGEAGDADPAGAAGTSAAPPEQRGHSTEYDRLMPLFAERAALPVGHPRRHELRTTLINEHLPVARHIARKYGYRGDSPEDLEQVATVGLILAVDRFDPGRGVGFLSFAVPTISGEVLRYFRDRAGTIRVPRRLRELQSVIYDAAAELSQRHGRAARPSEIAAFLGLDVERVLEGLQAQGVSHPASLDEPTRDDGSPDARKRLDAALGQVEPEFDLVEHRQGLAPLLAALPARERRILLLRFFGNMTQSQIAAQVGLSQMHVSRILTRTLATVRRKLTTPQPW